MKLKKDGFRKIVKCVQWEFFHFKYWLWTFFSHSLLLFQSSLLFDWPIIDENCLDLSSTFFSSSSSLHLLLLLLRLGSQCGAPLFCKKIRRQLRLYRCFFIFSQHRVSLALSFYLENICFPFCIMMIVQYGECLLDFALWYSQKDYKCNEWII